MPIKFAQMPFSISDSITLAASVHVYGDEHVQLTLSIWGDGKDIFVAHPITIMETEVSTFNTVVIYFRGYVPCVWSGVWDLRI